MCIEGCTSCEHGFPCGRRGYEAAPVVPVDDEPRNPYRTLHARMSPPGAAWDEGFAAGRAAERAATDAHGDNLAHWVREWLRFDNDREPPGPNAPYSARLGYESARLNVTEMVSDALAGWEVARSVPSDPKETNDE